MARKVVSAAHLYAILDRDFRKAKPAACEHCRMPLPFWQDSPDEVSANWTVGTPKTCPHGCHVVIAELLATLWPRYDLERRSTQ